MGLGITVEDLVKIYRIATIDVQALRGLNMTVKDGELISVIGPSGSGKTTLLNIMGGLSSATAGTVKVGDTEVTSLRENELVEYRRKTAGYIFQTLNLMPTLTAAENIELPMMALKVPRSERGERVKDLLDIVGLTHRAGHKPGELSGGEQQRIAIASALANDPPVILADEPTGELDSVNSKLVVDYLLKVNEEMGKTIVMVTHDPVVARVGSRILKIEDGLIRAALEPTQISAEERAVTFIDQIRMRMVDLQGELESLDERLKDGLLGGDEYFEEKQKLVQTVNVYKDELHRLGVVT
ncbi:MAG: ABC transporter ATP-binding protein [Candidatus Bathyarchaeota archaeon]|nr:ABC transporter ATP-binding protein [Candidatus Bathyarchaeota archaeon]